MQHSSHLAGIVGAIIFLLLIAAITLAISKRIRLPFSVLLVVVGIVFSSLADTYPDYIGLLHGISLSPDLILFVFLPTLIFESAYSLDARAMWRNLLPILTLAVPGLLLSTAIIGAIIFWATAIPLHYALLLGAILSATDPVAVIALFKKLGAPKRLTILVEGESLFNDATAIVLAGILLAFATSSSGFSSANILGGIADFFIVFTGGLVVGGLLGWLTGIVLGTVRSDPLIEITMTTILAYASFLIAESLLHVSGVMATVAAGLTLGSWGQFKVSASVRNYVHHFWEYIGFVATALIFLMVGMRVEFSAMLSSIDELAWLLVAMLLSRLVVVYGLIPVVNLLPRTESTNRSYQAVMFWGGLRGAIALAIVLSLPAFPYHDTFVALVMGAVLFTLLAQGLSMEWLVQKLGLDKPPLHDQIALAVGNVSARLQAMQRLPELEAGGLFSSTTANRLRRQCTKSLQTSERKLTQLRSKTLTTQDEINLLYLRCFAMEKTLYIDLFNKGHISEAALRHLLPVLTMQIESIRYHHKYESIWQHRLPRQRVGKTLLHLLDRIPGLGSYAEKMRQRTILHGYEVAWAHFQACHEVLNYLDSIDKQDEASRQKVEPVRDQYRHWQALARTSIDEMAAYYPEFVSAMQERLGLRLVLLTEIDAIRQRARHGELPAGVAGTMIQKREDRLWELSREDVAPLKISPEELLSKVPFFTDLGRDAFNEVASHMQPLSIPMYDTIIRQDDPGDALYIIARGVVRVSRVEDGGSRDLATLVAGDFFGEMALLHDAPRIATVQAVTPCSLYRLKRDDLAEAMDKYPGIRTALEDADMARQQADTEPEK